jgi:hypothetical protein
MACRTTWSGILEVHEVEYKKLTKWSVRSKWIGVEEYEMERETLMQWSVDPPEVEY